MWREIKDRVWEGSGRALIAFDASRLARLCSAQSSSCQVSLVSCMRQRASASAPSWARREAKSTLTPAPPPGNHIHAIPPRFGIND